MAMLSQVRASTAPAPGVAGMRVRTISVAAIAVAYSATLSTKAPSMPMPASSRPPTVGPTMRLELPAPTSSAIAVAMRSRPMTSPMIVRRSGLSVAQPQPLMKLAAAKCQTSSVPSQATIDSRADVRASSADHAGERQPPVEPLGEGAEEGAEQAHRQQAQHGDHGDDEGRAGLLVDDDAHDDRLQPAHGRDDHADVPQPPVVGRDGAQQASEGYVGGVVLAHPATGAHCIDATVL